MSAHFAVISAATRPALRLEIDLDMLADEVATRVAARLADRIAAQAPSPLVDFHKAWEQRRMSLKSDWFARRRCRAPSPPPSERTVR